MGLFDLTGQVAVVTGGSRGIGSAIALRMAEAGARVVVSSRKIDACEEVVGTIRAAGGEAIAVACNVTHIDQLHHLVEKSMEAFGRIDCLVGNAAVNPHYGPMTTIGESAFEKIVNCNVRANLWLSRLVLPRMAERRNGSIIFISSIAGIKGTDDIGTYGISKAAIMAMARNLAVTWGGAQHPHQHDCTGSRADGLCENALGESRNACPNRGAVSHASHRRAG